MPPPLLSGDDVLFPGDVPPLLSGLDDCALEEDDVSGLLCDELDVSGVLLVSLELSGLLELSGCEDDEVSGSLLLSGSTA